jgi:Cys-tRNA(Pro)/Cys-tRNA(Cys) deacylase
MRKTNALRLLEAAGVAHEPAPYALEDVAFSAGAVADALGLAHERVFKTLAARGKGGTCLAVLPGGSELDLKALARAAGERRMDLLPVAELEDATGYRRGAVTALSTKRPLPVYLDSSALNHRTIAVSAGTEGLQVLVAPEDYVEVTGALVVAIARS